MTGTRKPSREKAAPASTWPASEARMTPATARAGRTAASCGFGARVRDRDRTDGMASARHSRSAIHVVVACYLGWMLDSFDFFIMVFALDTVARTFGVPVSATAWALTATLACRVVGGGAVRAHRRPLRQAADHDDQRAVLRRPGAAVGPGAQLHRVPDPARAVWRRHGRGMGRRRVAGDGERAGTLGAARCRGSCRPAIRPATCWPRCCSSPSRGSAGAACSSPAPPRRCWCSTSAAPCRRARIGCRTSTPRASRYCRCCAGTCP